MSLKIPRPFSAAKHNLSLYIYPKRTQEGDKARVVCYLSDDLLRAKYNTN